MARVSVCIPSYNLAAVIGETIQSVLAQTFTDFELLIEDEGSTDDSVAVIRASIRCCSLAVILVICLWCAISPTSCRHAAQMHHRV